MLIFIGILHNAKYDQEIRKIHRFAPNTFLRIHLPKNWKQPTVSCWLDRRFFCNMIYSFLVTSIIHFPVLSCPFPVLETSQHFLLVLTQFNQTLLFLLHSLHCHSIQNKLLYSRDETRSCWLGGSARIPKVRETRKDYFGGKTLNERINPEKVVAYGAAMKVANMNGSEWTVNCV